MDYVNDPILRFYGNFFIGDVESLVNFFNTTLTEIELFTKTVKHRQLNKVINETGYWYYLEKFRGLHVDWYFAECNDQILENLVW